jgi:hypothetical protein
MSKNERVDSIAEKAAAALTMDKKTGVGGLGEDFFASQLPETLTLEQVTESNSFQRDFNIGVTRAFGKLAVETLAENKKLDTVTLETTAAPDTKLNIATERSRTYKNNFGDKQPTTKYAVTTVEFQSGLCTTSAGALKKELKAIGQLGLDQLK